MPKPGEHIPEEVLREAVKESNATKAGFTQRSIKVQIPEGHHPQRRIFKRRRGGIVLSREQVKEIKVGRRKLRKDMRSQGIKDKEQFELTAASLGLYFDKRRGLLAWLLKGHGLLALLGAALLLLLVLYLMSLISQLRGYFTINLSDGLFREGFVLSETEDFANPKVSIYCEPAVDVPCVSIAQIREDIDDGEGQHNGDYFAFTFFLRNEGDSTVDYIWQLELNDESKQLSDSAWVMVFEDGGMRFYAEANELDSGEECLPARGDDSRGYINLPLTEKALDPEQQYELIAQRGDLGYYRVIPYPFESEELVTTGLQTEVKPWDVHRYTVVIWVEGDDPDTTNDKIGGHLGLDMQFKLLEEAEEESEPTVWARIWNWVSQLWS